LKFEAIEYQVLLPSNQNSLPGNAKVYSECLLYRLAMQISFQTVLLIYSN